MRYIKGFVVFCLLTVLVLSGCTSRVEEVDVTVEPESVNLVIVSGNRSNCPTPAFHSNTVRDAVRNAVSNFGSVTLVIADGKPYSAAAFEIQAQQKALSANKLRSIAEQQTEQIICVVENAKAKTAEADLLAAIELAVRALHSGGDDGCMLICDSGLSTTGVLDFTQNLLKADVETVLTHLRENDALPNLQGVKVFWVGLGDVAGEQEPLTEGDRKVLKSIWRGVLESADEVVFWDDLPSQTYDKSLPYVSPVPVTQPMPLVIEAETLSQPIVLDESTLRFLPDSTSFADPLSAKEALTPIAEYLRATGRPILLAGTTATVGENEPCCSFSLYRAEAVKTVLVEMGADDCQIITLGLGWDHPYHIPDIDENGNQNENAPLNRTVMVFDATSDEAIDLINNYT